VIIIPVYFKDFSDDELNKRAHELKRELREVGVRAEVDDSDVHNPGFKYAAWELKGVPLRLELGPKDMQSGEVRCVRRLDGKKF
jgi:prolyl-tRNA synthetase